MITLAIPTYNRIDYLFESFSNIISNNLISEICIVDDCSDIQIYNEVCNKIEQMKTEKYEYKKIKIYRNEANLGAFLNKLECVKKSSNDWIILLDSDNIINLDYLEIIKNSKDPNMIYAPSHAICDSPFLNYSKYAGIILDKIEYKKVIEDGIWDCILNTGNYFFNKINYLKCVEMEKELENPLASDVYYLIYLWFKNLENVKLEIVKDLKYIHRLHIHSYYHTIGSHVNFIDNIKNKIRLFF